MDLVLDLWPLHFSIKSGDNDIVIAGGQESMSLAPHTIHLRDGKKLGDTEL